jgi:nucleotide-binding universal stress UspA family protein
VGEVEEERRFEKQACTRLLKEAAAYAAEQGLTMRTEIRAGHPAQEIARAARDHDADLVGVGHTGHSGEWAGSWARPPRRSAATPPARS